MQCRVYSRQVIFIAAIVGMIAIALPAFATQRQQKRDYKQQVEALEEQWRNIQLANDVNAMDKLLSDDYIGISMTGQIYTKAQQLERMRTKKLTLTQIKFDEMKVKLIGAIAIVTSRTDIEGVNDDVPVKGTYRYTRVYRRMPTGVWKITSFEATRVPKAKQPPGEAGQPISPAQGGTEHAPPTSQLVPTNSSIEILGPSASTKPFLQKENLPTSGRFSHLWRTVRVRR